MLRYLGERGKLTMDFRPRDHTKKRSYDSRKGLIDVLRLTILKLSFDHDRIDTDTLLIVGTFQLCMHQRLVCTTSE